MTDLAAVGAFAQRAGNLGRSRRRRVGRAWGVSSAIRVDAFLLVACDATFLVALKTLKLLLKPVYVSGATALSAPDGNDLRFLIASILFRVAGWSEVRQSFHNQDIVIQSAV